MFEWHTQLGTPKLRNVDPYLMLDELKLPVNQASAGFPNHPHRCVCSTMQHGSSKCVLVVLAASGLMLDVATPSAQDTAGGAGEAATWQWSRLTGRIHCWLVICSVRAVATACCRVCCLPVTAAAVLSAGLFGTICS